ncbi:MAG: TIGR02147 family protein [Proteobacteria bacterium]|nr:TIGR02147 family protein [Pseudomonadota bacterium]NDC23294.1 TIGR02147 family protein [Pseudomonadota bacterium]NDD03457.1 TIGR02147 family protein [Pseudomonadota bacterium]NDG25888.1 TIGR02147 family protein [Pseudomonadota bacterium]
MSEKVTSEISMAPNLFDYYDYRDFLQDFYQFHKKRNAAYSYRLFARKAKLGSPNYLKLVVDGKRRITDRTLYQFSRGLGLSKDEEKYFRELVMYQEVSDPDSKDQHLKALLKYQEKQRTPTPLTEARVKALTDWHHLVIRELVATRSFKEDTHWIVKRLGGKITEAQAQESLDLLIKLKLLRRNSEGKLEQCEALLTSSGEVPGHLLRGLHRFYLRKALASIFSVTPEKREMSGLLLAVPTHRLKEVKEEIKEFRKKLNRKYGMDKNADEVFFTGLYLFPITQKAD